MLVCQLIVWCLLTANSLECIDIYATELGCYHKVVELFPKAICLEIDKRRGFTKAQWDEDICGLSEHKWLGEINVQKVY